MTGQIEIMLRCNRRRGYALELERGFARDLETARAESSAVVMWRAARRLRLVRWVLGLPLSAELRATRPVLASDLSPVPDGIEECEDNACAGCQWCDLFDDETDPQIEARRRP